jgi:hypothetical protein
MPKVESRKLSDGPKLKLLAVANELLTNSKVPEYSDEILESADDVMRFADEIMKSPISNREAQFVRGVCSEWREGVASGKWKDCSGPLAMKDEDYIRVVVMRTMFYCEPKVVRSKDE